MGLRVSEHLNGSSTVSKKLPTSSVLTKVFVHLQERSAYITLLIRRREKTPTPKTRFSIWTLLRAPDRFTTGPLPVYFTTKMSVVRPFRSLVSKAEILGVGVFSPLST